MTQQQNPPSDDKKLVDWEQELRDEGYLQEDQHPVVNPPGQDSMSDTLFALLGEDIAAPETLQEVRHLILLAVIAWNASLFDGEQREDFLKSVQISETGDLRAYVNALIDRKLQQFPHNHRFIYDYKIVEEGDKLHISVATESS